MHCCYGLCMLHASLACVCVTAFCYTRAQSCRMKCSPYTHMLRYNRTMSKAFQAGHAVHASWCHLFRFQRFQIAFQSKEHSPTGLWRSHAGLWSSEHFNSARKTLKERTQNGRNPFPLKTRATIWRRENRTAIPRVTPHSFVRKAHRTGLSNKKH